MYHTEMLDNYYYKDLADDSFPSNKEIILEIAKSFNLPDNQVLFIKFSDKDKIGMIDNNGKIYIADNIELKDMLIVFLHEYRHYQQLKYYQEIGADFKWSSIHEKDARDYARKKYNWVVNEFGLSGHIKS